MPCYQPLAAYESSYINPTGNRRLVFNPAKGIGPRIDLPCGRCVGCRLEYAKEWALRCYHEASLHENNQFITLTYAPEHLPENGTLVKAHHKDFIKRIRHLDDDIRIRYFMSGEYGTQCANCKRSKENCTCANFSAADGRPHYHILFFNLDLPDKKYWRTTAAGEKVYRSETIESKWTYGHSEIGTVTFKSAGYVARYTLKKQTGERGAKHYGDLKRIPPYVAMSLKPGIGYHWYRKYKQDLFPHDYAVLPDGRQTSVPRYYRELLRKEDPDLYEQLRLARVEKAASNPDNTCERLEVREKNKIQSIKRLQRTL